MTTTLRTATVRLTASALILFAMAFATSTASAQKWQKNIRLEPGDIIVSVNGQNINCSHDFVDAVNNSGPKMQFTIIDCRTGNYTTMTTWLRNNGFRFGVHVKDHWNGGVRITNVMPNSAATACTVNSFISSNGNGGAAAACKYEAD